MPYSVTICEVVCGYVPNSGAMLLVKDRKEKNMIN